MTVWGKLAGAAAGMALGGPIGALLGAVAGHVYDDWKAEKLELETKPPPPPPPYGEAPFSMDPIESRKVAFASAIIVLSAKLAKVDGAVTKDEIRAFKKHFSVTDADVGSVAAIFNEAKQDSRGFEVYAMQVAELFGHDPAVLEELVDGLFVIAAADGNINRPELEFIAKVAALLGFSPRQFMIIQARYQALYQRQYRHQTPKQPSSAAVDPYQVLGLTSAASDEEIKKTYRNLVREHHPDRLTAKGMPEEFIKRANDKLASINAAFDTIAAERSLK